MTAITPQQFLDVLMHLESFDSEEQMEPLLDRFGEEQPLLAAFLDEMGGEDFNEDEHEVKFFTSCKASIRRPERINSAPSALSSWASAAPIPSDAPINQ